MVTRIKKETTRMDSFFKTKGIYDEQEFYSKSADAGVTGASDTMVNCLGVDYSKSAEAGVAGARSVAVVVDSGALSLKSAAAGVTGAKVERFISDTGTTSEKSASDGVVGARVIMVELRAVLSDTFLVSLFDAKRLLIWSVKTAAMIIVVVFISFGSFGLMKQR